VVGHASYELASYAPAEAAYVKVIEQLPKGQESRDDITDNLAAAIYKQGEEANAAQNYQAAADHFLRVGKMAPHSKIRANAEFDAAGALIQLKQWGPAATVLTGFRQLFPDHPLLPEVTKKMAFVYKEDGKLSLAAKEYERIEAESEDEQIRKEALQLAAELYVQDGDKIKALTVYRRYVAYFARPVEVNLETRNKIADILKEQGDRVAYLKELRSIVAIDSSAGDERTDRTRYLAASASLVLAEDGYAQFTAVKLVKPIERNLAKKRERMKAAVKAFNKLAEYEIGETTAAATFYIAEIYAHFSKALLTSERPELTFDYYVVKPGDNLSVIAKRSNCDIGRIVQANHLKKSSLLIAGKKLKIPRGLYPEELEQYELAIEEQAYPFEEKAISIHESNLGLLQLGVYNEWIDKSMKKLSVFMPARYDKPEEHSGVVASMESFRFATAKPVPVASPTADEQTAGKASDAPTGDAPPTDDGAQAEGPKTDSDEPKGDATFQPETVSDQASAPEADTAPAASEVDAESVALAASTAPDKSESESTTGEKERHEGVAVQ